MCVIYVVLCHFSCFICIITYLYKLTAINYLYLYFVNKGFLSDHRARAISLLGAKDNRYYHWPWRSNY